WVGRFSSESREVFVARFKVLKALGLKPGQRVADVGAGTGLYTRLLAKAVGPAGKVYAVDISQPFLDLIAADAAAAGLANVTTVLGEDHSARLPDASVDVVFHCDTYHHFEYPRSMTRDLARALRPGGEMFVLDFERIPGISSAFILNHVRASKETVISEIEASGFELVEELDLPSLEENYLLRFRKSRSPTASSSGSD
ncbi:MAG: methyltransferase domain-containing protein, partial [Acidobacteria bacterium]|nr:methyltransferase domain-containing protein [Acidobacteriota bacterium]